MLSSTQFKEKWAVLRAADEILFGAVFSACAAATGGATPPPLVLARVIETRSCQHLRNWITTGGVETSPTGLDFVVDYLSRIDTERLLELPAISTDGSTEELITEQAEPSESSAEYSPTAQLVSATITSLFKLYYGAFEVLNVLTPEFKTFASESIVCGEFDSVMRSLYQTLGKPPHLSEQLLLAHQLLGQLQLNYLELKRLRRFYEVNAKSGVHGGGDFI